MKRNTIPFETLECFGAYLRQEEKSASTIEKYMREITRFADWLGASKLDREAALNWKKQLLSQKLSPATINAALSSLNKLFSFIGRNDCRLKYLKIQRKMFRSDARDLKKDDYIKLLDTAQKQGKLRLALLIESICATGVRVSEVKYITVEAAKTGRTDINLKGKIRTILLPSKLCHKLVKCAKKQKITSGEIFLTRSGRGLSRRQIWAEMKRLCKDAGVLPTKVFPHNLRHLFASRFYQVCRDIVKLADVLGHSSIETTRIYLIATEEEHVRQIERLGLIL